ncbi:MAG: hypothetical protein MJ180_00385 [Candidatus Gastranaerophilales bacterium]|nr:hypothetical protein [Candidatus Gastranaerophilales bacterium]
MYIQSIKTYSNFGNKLSISSDNTSKMRTMKLDPEDIINIRTEGNKKQYISYRTLDNDIVGFYTHTKLKDLYSAMQIAKLYPDIQEIPVQRAKED